MPQYSGGGGAVAGVQGGYAPLDSGLHVPLQYLNGITPTQLTSAAGVVYGVYAKIAETILNAPAANVPFTSIPASFRHLELYILSRCDNAVTSNNLLIQFNGDTAANYEFAAVTGNNNTSTEASSNAQTSALIGWASGANAPAGKAAESKITIFQYAGTTFHKTLNFHAGLWRGTSNGVDQFVQTGAGNWLSTAAITSILVFPAAGNFIAGSCFSLYGIQ